MADVVFIVSIFLFILFVTTVIALTINYFILLPQSTTVIELRDKTKSVFDLFFGSGGIVTNQRVTTDVTRIPVQLVESNGTNRTNELVGVLLNYDNSCINKAWNNSVRIYNQNFNKQPSRIGTQVLCSNQYLNTSTIGFLVNITANTKQIVYVYYLNNTNTVGSNENISVNGYWPLDENSGTAVSDYSGYDNNGTLINSPVWATGKFGNAVRFNGVNQYINISNSNALNRDMTNLTLAGWIYANQTSGADAGLFGKGTSVYGLTYNNDGNVYFYINGATNNVNTAISTGTWHHVAGVYNQTTLVLYVDGSLATSAASSATSTGTGGTFYIGRATNYFNGTIDEVRFYNRTLSSSEISQLYAGPLTTNILPEENITAIQADKLQTLVNRSYNDIRTVLGSGWNFRVEIKGSG